MRSDKSISQVFRLLLLIASICLPVIVTAQENQPKGEATISGRVIFADTGKPVRRATVRLISDLNREPYRTTPANLRGEFRFNEVRAGTYFVIAEAQGGFSSGEMFAITEFGFNRESQLEATRVTVDGKGAARCDVRVVRAGSIRGTIVYSDKEPVTGAPISLFRRKNGVIMPFLTRRIYTNDRGMYRIDGLLEGEYFVGVVDSSRTHNSLGPGPSTGVVTAYYPGVSSIAEANVIQIESGSDVSAVDMTLGDDDLRRLSGVVKWRSDGKPVTKASLMLRRKDEPQAQVSFDRFLKLVVAQSDLSADNMFHTVELLGTVTAPTAEANKRGEWKFEDLPPGKYVLTAYASLSEKDNPDDEKLSEVLNVPEYFPTERMVSRQIELTVADEDLKEIVVELSEGGRISGSIIGGESKLPPIRISVDRKGEITDDLLGGQSKEDGSFLVEGVPGGDVRLEVFVPWGEGEDYYVKSVTLGNLDLLRNPLRVEEGAEVTGVRITLARGLATLSGRALFNEGGLLAGGSGVLLINADRSLWRSPNSRFFVVTNPSGEFTLQCPPGDYLVFTWAPGNEPLQSVDEYARTQATSARRITLQSGEEKQIELTVAKPKE